MKKIYLSLLFIISVSLGAVAQTSVFSENFDDVNNMLLTGWTQVNNSLPLGPEIWHQGTTGVGATPVSGTADSYAEASYQSTDPAGSGDISNWLISPTVTLNNGDAISFFAASYNNGVYPDRLELRINPLNTVDCGTTPTSTGDFSILATTINPSLLADTAYFPTLYFGQINASVSGLSGATACRIAFRYWVTDGGGTGLNSSTIGIDSFNVTTIVGIKELDTYKTTLYPNPAQSVLNCTWYQPLASDVVADVYNSMGQKVYSKELSKGLHRSELNIANLSKGFYTVIFNGDNGSSRNTFIKN